MTAKTAKRYTPFRELKRGQTIRVYERHQDGPRRVRMALVTEGTIAGFEALGSHSVAVDAMGRELVASFSRGKSVERVR